MKALLAAVGVMALMVQALPALAGGALVVREAEKQVVLRGYTRAADSQDLTAEVGGRVSVVNYDVGQAVSDAPFIEIDTTFVDLSIKSADKQLERLRSARKRAESQASYLEKEFRRTEGLYREGRVPATRYDAAEQALAQARLELSSVRSESEAVEVGLRELRERRSRHSIRPPRGWIITARLVDPGEVVQPGMPLGKASDFTRMVVPLSVSMRELEALQALGNSVGANLERVPVIASLKWQNPEFDERTRKSAVEIAVASPPGIEPRGGLSLEIPLTVRTEGLLVPRAAVSWRYENPRVTLKATGRVVPLVVFDESGEYLVVADDGALRPGDELLPEDQTAPLR